MLSPWREYGGALTYCFLLAYIPKRLQYFIPRLSHPHKERLFPPFTLECAASQWNADLPSTFPSIGVGSQVGLAGRQVAFDADYHKHMGLRQNGGLALIVNDRNEGERGKWCLNKNKNDSGKRKELDI
jgi:hypothetical protein